MKARVKPVQTNPKWTSFNLKHTKNKEIKSETFMTWMWLGQSYQLILLQIGAKLGANPQ